MGPGALLLCLYVIHGARCPTADSVLYPSGSKIGREFMF